MIRMDLAELYRDNHLKARKEKQFTVEYIYGKSLLKNKEVEEEKEGEKCKILNIMKEINNLGIKGNQVSSLSN